MDGGKSVKVTDCIVRSLLEMRSIPPLLDPFETSALTPLIRFADRATREADLRKWHGENKKHVKKIN